MSLRLISMIPHIRLPNTGGFGAQKARWEGKLILTLHVYVVHAIYREGALA